jgi:hypothetical protein
MDTIADLYIVRGEHGISYGRKENFGNLDGKEVIRIVRNYDFAQTETTFVVSFPNEKEELKGMEVFTMSGRPFTSYSGSKYNILEEQKKLLDREGIDHIVERERSETVVDILDLIPYDAWVDGDVEKGETRIFY